MNEDDPVRFPHTEFATRGEFDNLKTRVDELHAGILGTSDFPGGLRAQIQGLITTLPTTVAKAIEEHELKRQEARAQSRRSFLWDLVKVTLATVIGIATLLAMVLQARR